MEPRQGQNERSGHDQREPEERPAPHSNTEKDPDDWITGDGPMTGAQASYLQTLCEESGEAFDPNLTKADASKRIDELRHKTGRGERRQILRQHLHSSCFRGFGVEGYGVFAICAMTGSFDQAT